MQFQQAHHCEPPACDCSGSCGTSQVQRDAVCQLGTEQCVTWLGIKSTIRARSTLHQASMEHSVKCSFYHCHVGMGEGFWSLTPANPDPSPKALLVSLPTTCKLHEGLHKTMIAPALVGWAPVFSLVREARLTSFNVPP